MIICFGKQTLINKLCDFIFAIFIQYYISCLTFETFLIKNTENVFRKLNNYILEGICQSKIIIILYDTSIAAKM